MNTNFLLQTNVSDWQQKEAKRTDCIKAVLFKSHVLQPVLKQSWTGTRIGGLERIT